MIPINLRENNRAVSPVIGVILMVAITVILAAVIGTFVLTLGDDVDREISAGTSFNSDSESATVQWTSEGNADQIRVTYEVTDEAGSFTNLDIVGLNEGSDEDYESEDSSADEVINSVGQSSTIEVDSETEDAESDTVTVQITVLGENTDDNVSTLLRTETVVLEIPAGGDD